MRNSRTGVLDLPPRALRPAKGLLLAAWATAMVLVSAQAPPCRASIAVGDSAVDFTLQDFSGNLYTLRDYRGRVVLLAFIGHSCVRCRFAGPAVERVWQDFKGSGKFQILALDVWNGKVPDIQAFISVTGVTFPVLMRAGPLQIDYPDGYGLQNDNYVILDPSGYVVYTSNEGPYPPGGSRWDDAVLRRILRNLLPTGVESDSWTAIKTLYR